MTGHCAAVCVTLPMPAGRLGVSYLFSHAVIIEGKTEAITRVLLAVKADAWSEMRHYFSYISDSQGKVPGHHKARML